MSPKTGNPVYERPVVLVHLSRGPQVPARPDHPAARAARSPTTISSSPRSPIARAPRSSSRPQRVIAPLARALGPGGRLIAIHSHGHDPGHGDHPEGLAGRQSVHPRPPPDPQGGEAGARRRPGAISTSTPMPITARCSATTCTRCRRRSPNSIGTSTLFAAWNAAIYVAQVEDDRLAERGRRRPLSRRHARGAARARRAVVLRRVLRDLAPARVTLSIAPRRQRRTDEWPALAGSGRGDVRSGRRASPRSWRGFSLEATRPSAGRHRGARRRRSAPARASISARCRSGRPQDIARSRGAAARRRLRAGAAPRGAQLRQRSPRSTISWRGSPARPACGGAGDRRRPRPSAAGASAARSRRSTAARLRRRGIREIGIAGYPDGHPRIGERRARPRARRQDRRRGGDRAGGRDRHPVLLRRAARSSTWSRGLRDFGFEHPVRIGLAGPTELTTADALCQALRRARLRAGAGAPRRPDAAAVRHATPDILVRALAEARAHGISAISRRISSPSADWRSRALGARRSPSAASRSSRRRLPGRAAAQRGLMQQRRGQPGWLECGIVRVYAKATCGRWSDASPNGSWLFPSQSSIGDARSPSFHGGYGRRMRGRLAARAGAGQRARSPTTGAPRRRARSAKSAFIAWMVKNRGEDPGFLGAALRPVPASCIARHDVWDERDMRAFLLTPREEFVTAANLDRAYEWHHLNIGFGVTITGPHTVARMTNTHRRQARRQGARDRHRLGLPVRLSLEPDRQGLVDRDHQAAWRSARARSMTG